jgi:hypothetical protein
MAKCSNCGKSGLFLKLQSGLCNDCISLAHRRTQVEQLETRERNSAAHLADLTSQLADQQSLYDSVVEKAKAEGITQARAAIKSEQDAADKKLAETTAQLKIAEDSLSSAKIEEEKTQKSVSSSIKKVEKYRPLLRAIQNAIDTYDAGEFSNNLQIDSLIEDVDDFVTPTVILDLQCLGMKDLRKRYRQNEKQIEELLVKYEGRYTTKANATIYKLMVIALRAELQNVLYSINYGKLEDALNNIDGVTEKYFNIATSGNQSIAPTMKKFIGEINYFFREAVKIEYEYYVQKERAKEEQRAIREQMRQEAEERRALEAEKKKIEKEESKFQGQIAQIEEQLSSAEPDKIAQLEARLAELHAQLGAVKEKKDTIATLQNGKAGNVYVISNLGSFGDEVFKIGMTRRTEPQERIDELGDASVPFPFDVHSFIFSDDAAALEHRIHDILNDRRVNKVNLRKEFFHISLDELESLVSNLAPTAEFKRTMLAEQYRQSLSIDKIVEASIDSEDDDE